MGLTESLIPKELTVDSPFALVKMSPRYQQLVTIFLLCVVSTSSEVPSKSKNSNKPLYKENYSIDPKLLEALLSPGISVPNFETSTVKSVLRPSTTEQPLQTTTQLTKPPEPPRPPSREHKALKGTFSTLPPFLLNHKSCNFLQSR